jgi:hypothetical protein
MLSAVSDPSLIPKVDLFGTGLLFCPPRLCSGLESAVMALVQLPRILRWDLHQIVFV